MSDAVAFIDGFGFGILMGMFFGMAGVLTIIGGKFGHKSMILLGVIFMILSLGIGVLSVNHRKLLKKGE